jgi:hypothetical protein
MMRKGLMVGTLSALAVGLLAVRAHAGDTVRLTIGSAKSIVSDLTPADPENYDDTLLVRGGRGGFGHGFHAGFHSGFHTGFRSFGRVSNFRFRNNFVWGGNRFWGWGGNGFWGWGGNRAWVWGGNRCWGWGGNRVWFCPPSCCAPTVTFYPIRLGGGAVLSDGDSYYGDPSSAPPSADYPPVPARVPGRDFTYPYDGGPRNPVPQPSNVDPAPSATPKPTLPLEGKPVSLPISAKSTQFAYPAYGEDRMTKPAKPSSFAEDRETPKKKVDTRSLAGK